MSGKCKFAFKKCTTFEFPLWRCLKIDYIRPQAAFFKQLLNPLCSELVHFLTHPILMVNSQAIRGIFLILISTAFGLSSLDYKIGQFSKAGPGLFPLVISGMLLLIGLAMVIQSRFITSEPMQFNLSKISIIIVSLCGFAVLSNYLNMSAGIFFLVFVSTSAGQNYSAIRNVKIFIGLWLIAFAFKQFLGLNLPLI